MGKYLITGRSGVGKSASCRELLARGINAFDGDKIASWRNPTTNKPIEVDYSRVITPSYAVWNWDQSKLHSILASDTELFLCGSADNQLEFHGLFDMVFILTIDPKVQTERIMARVEHDYGKTQGMLEHIIKEQAEFFEEAMKLGAVGIDATPSPKIVVDTILGKING